MTIKVGDKLPEATFAVMGAEGPGPRKSADIFSGRTVVLFAVPGAYTPTCNNEHLPGFIKNAAAFKAKGVDEVCCTAVNDVFVMDAWGKSLNAGANVTMLADGSAAFTKAIGMELDLVEAGLGLRSQRYAMLVKDGVVAALNLEDVASCAVISSAEKLLQSM